MPSAGTATSAGKGVLAAVMAVTVTVSGCGSGAPPASVPNSTAPNSTAGAGRTLDASTSQKLDAAIADALTASKSPGVMVGVWSPEGDYVKAFGVADTVTQAPMRTDFYSRIGSVTKTFTATALLQLVDEGKIGLDDPIARYVDGVPGGESITLRQLATMRSGLPDYLDNDDFSGAMIADPAQEFTPQQLLGYAFASPPVSPPGRQWQYSNTNYILLGLVVEKIGGKPLSDYLEERVLGPLGLMHTSFPTATEFPDPHAQGYSAPLAGEGPPVVATEWTASYTWAAGAMISSLDDLRVWMPALANGDLISPALQQQRLESPPTPGLPPGVGYGMGVFDAAGWIGHNGGLPGYQTVAIHLPQRRMTVVAMINSDITPPGGPQPSTAVVGAITAILTPGHVYDV